MAKDERSTPKTKRDVKNKIDSRTLDKWSGLARESSLVETELYTKYDVKRGLRDLSGRGVLAGLTQIGGNSHRHSGG